MADHITLPALQTGSLDEQNRLILLIDEALARHALALAKVQGQDGMTATLSSNLDLDGHVIKNAGRATANTDLTRVQDIRENGLFSSPGQPLKTKKVIEANGGVRVPDTQFTASDAINSSTLTVALSNLDATAAPPKVDDISAIGTANGHFAREQHTHQGVNLDAPQTITARKTFQTDLVSPLIIGGTGVGSVLALRSTTGNGTTDAIIFQVGNNGSIEALRIGHAGVSVSTATITSLLTVTLNTSPLQPPPAGTVFHIGGADGTGQRLLFDGYGNFLTMTFRRASGTAASPTALTSGVTVGAINAFGYGATAYTTTARASINFNTAEAWTDTAQGMVMTFRTTPIGTASSLEAMRIDDVGHIGIGTTTPAVSALIDLTSTTAALLLSRMTTTQRDALTAVNGMLIYNTTTSKLQGYEAGAWTNLI